MRIFLYLCAIVLANVITANFAPLQFGVFIIPYGSFLIGATFILRDLVQNKYGKKKTYLFIGLALILSAISSYLLGDTLWIVFASAVSFAVSETTDTEIYSRLKASISMRIMYSGIFGGILDSSIFVIIGLSPLGAGMVPWNAVWMAILGQVIIKISMQIIGVMALHFTRFTKTEFAS
ncbi:VUT family protein [Rummeliibacillus sp. TYF005]|uniref:VUT family protein n=1 Tax=Rummeliibacillus sp. TYF005 TaxID=2058214 RepID=UPI000F521067|nr:VUT family protein [Rummeliibacillus sp. TYF005]RPJ94596.1 VUT family protein [Rummeliibacillus sp. TYF005]